MELFEGQASAGEWRYFPFSEVAAAREHAAAGGVAVHHTGMPFRRWGFTCHLFARDEAALRAAARKIQVNQRWLQHPGTPRAHFDVFGRPLEDALALCTNGDDAPRGNLKQGD